MGQLNPILQEEGSVEKVETYDWKFCFCVCFVWYWEVVTPYNLVCNIIVSSSVLSARAGTMLWEYVVWLYEPLAVTSWRRTAW
jgi:hypothetical protein